MAIVTLDQLVAGLVNGQRRFWNKSNPANTTGGTWVSLWKQGGNPGAPASNPPTGTGEVPTNATVGALPFTNPSGGNSAYLAQCSMAAAQQATVTLYDRLWHNSGLSGIATTSQTVSSLALTRPDSIGTGVECWLECNTATGVTARTLTVTYTDAANGSGRSGTIAVPASMPAQRMVPMANQAGDYSVQSVQSCILNGTTGTAGDFGLVLLRRIVDIPIVTTGAAVDRDPSALGMPQVYSGACLALFVLCGQANPGPFQGMYSVAVG